MQRFSIRSVLIFVICFLVATLLIGLGVGSVIKFKQRDFEQVCERAGLPFLAVGSVLVAATRGERACAIVLDYHGPRVANLARQVPVPSPIDTAMVGRDSVIGPMGCLWPVDEVNGTTR